MSSGDNKQNGNEKLVKPDNIDSKDYNIIKMESNSGVEHFSNNSDFFLDKVQSISNIGLYILDVNSGHWSSSKKLNDIFGINDNYTRDIKGWEDMLYPDDKEMMLEYFKNSVIGNKCPFNKEYRIISLSGNKVKWVHGKGELRFNKKGLPVTMIGTIQDITVRKRTEDLLKEKKQELEIFFQAALDMLCVADTSGNFIHVNPEWENVLGYTKAELEKQNFIDLVHPEDLKETLEAVSKLNNQNKVKNFVNRYRCKDGTYKYLEWRSAPSGKLIYAAARDITNRIEAEENLKSINQELRETSAQKDRFLSIVAHDIRNPLNNVLGIVELLKSNYTDYSEEEAGHIIALLGDSTDQLYQLIENLLEWALSKAVTSKPKLEEVDIFEITNETILLVKAATYHKKITIINKTSKECLVWADKNMVKTILRNLISNSIKYSYSDSEIIIYAEKQQDYLVTTVKDFGIGIRKKKIDTIFIPHEINETEGTAGEKGSGLGLPLCKELIEKMGGSIFIHSTPGKGTEIGFKLPCSKH